MAVWYWVCAKCGTYTRAEHLFCFCGNKRGHVTRSHWRCYVCDEMNPHDQESCARCGRARG